LQQILFYGSWDGIVTRISNQRIKYIKGANVNTKPNEEESAFYLEKRKLNALFDYKTPLDTEIYRGQRPQDRGQPILYPILKAFKLSNGKTRDPDIVTYAKNGEDWVSSSKGGISLFDILGMPVKSWDYYKLNGNIKIPKGLVITRDHEKVKDQPVHYSIRAHWDMPITKFCLLLDDLAAQLIQVK
jgi:hypothetical protein